MNAPLGASEIIWNFLKPKNLKTFNNQPDSNGTIGSRLQSETVFMQVHLLKKNFEKFETVHINLFFCH